jgi:hypothetical protein
VHVLLCLIVSLVMVLMYTSKMTDVTEVCHMLCGCLSYVTIRDTARTTPTVSENTLVKTIYVPPLLTVLSVLMDDDALSGKWDNSATLPVKHIAFTVTVHAHITHTTYTLVTGRTPLLVLLLLLLLRLLHYFVTCSTRQ